MKPLPKQWRHWCRSAGLYPGDRHKAKYVWFSLRGHGHVWRLNCYDQFQCGDKITDFDRWALCSPIFEVPRPSTRAEFIAAVRQLLDQHRTFTVSDVDERD